MGQKRYHNHEQALESLHENNRLQNLAPGGVYAGFDRIEPVVGTSIKFKHDITGIRRLNADGTADEGPFGIVVSRQGVVIEDDTEFPLTVPFTTALKRIDLIVAQHTHLDSAGGSSMTISRVQGAQAEYPSKPAVSNPAFQVIIGYLFINSPGTHTNTIFYPYSRRMLGGEFPFVKKSDSELRSAIVNDFNTITQPNFYHVATSSASPGNRPNANFNTWLLLVLRHGGVVVQMAWSNTGKAYTRASMLMTGDVVATWSTWASVNNSDVPAADLSGVNAAIGNRTYTEENFVANGESLTTSVDGLDMALQALNEALGVTQSLVTSLQADVSSLLTRFDAVVGGTDVNTIVNSGIYFVKPTSTNPPPGIVNYGWMRVYVDGTNVQQIVDLPEGGMIWRNSSNGGTTWSSWFISRNNTEQVRILTWNMDTTATHLITWVSIGIDPTKLVSLSAMISDDDGDKVLDLVQTGDGSLGGTVVSGQIIVDETDLILARATGGYFDSADYSVTPVGGRGNVYIEYRPF